jgi:predicted unusual protein kinase regulating ubiquinone biosynthesis (AarF/ABC1/UbiB family)
VASNKIGQALWDFLHVPNHILRKVHADPHPGNLVDENNNLVIDFDA